MSDNSLRRSERLSNLSNTNKQVVDGLLKTSEQVTFNVNNNNVCKPRIRTKFVCEKCSANSVIDRKRKTSYKNNNKPKLCFDSVLNKLLKVCNNCAKVMSTLKKSNQKRPKVLMEDQKERYLSSCHSFALSLAHLLNDRTAERLFCPNLKHSGTPCGCLQRYVIGFGNNLEEKRKRAQHLLNLLKKAKQLSQQKAYLTNNPKVERIGLGNGQKKSKEFENFISIHRKYLRKELHFCEKATQKVLFYSNNFLHKKLKTEPNNKRVERQKGKAATGKLIDIKLLTNESCCKYECVKMCETHFNLLSSWRQRAVISQMETRRVLSEMLTPTQGFRTNCYKFISLVTGSSFRTITSVNQYIRSNGGIREPLEHGLKNFWQQNANKQQINNNTVASQYESVNTNKEFNSDNNLVESSSYLQIIGSDVNNDDNVEQDRVHLLFTNNNQSVSVLNAGNTISNTTIAILNPQILNNQQTVQISLPITSVQLI